MKLFHLNVQFILIFHIGACVWIYVGKNQSPDEYTPKESGSWYDKQVTHYTKNNPPVDFHMHLYVTAMYFIVTTATTVGYGDNRAETVTEMMVLIVIQFVGIMVFSQLSG